MQCPNCGAELGEERVCPYCGFEDEQYAQQQHKKKVSSIYERIAKLLHTPVEQARKITKGMLIGTALILAVFLVSLIVAPLLSSSARKQELASQKDAIAQLEALYSVGDYQQIRSVLQNREDSYKAVYDKYRIISSLDATIQRTAQGLEHSLENIRKNPQFADLISFDLSQMIDVLRTCRELEEKGYVYDEQREAEALAAQAYDLLRTMLLTDEEIAAFMDDESAYDDYSDYDEISTMIAQRLREETAQ